MPDTIALRGVILAGGKDSRLALSNGLPPAQENGLAGIRDVLLVSGTEHTGDFMELLGSGRDHNCRLTYRVQGEAGGIAQALGLAELHCLRPFRKGMP